MISLRWYDGKSAPCTAPRWCATGVPNLVAGIQRKTDCESVKNCSFAGVSASLGCQLCARFPIRSLIRNRGLPLPRLHNFQFAGDVTPVLAKHSKSLVLG